MNLTRVLNNALPEIPARTFSERPPRIPPDVVSGEHIEGGEVVVRLLVPSQEAMYRFTKTNWTLAQLFDGTRTYEQVAEAFHAETGTVYGVDDVREFAASLEEMGFWYKTAQEKNVQLMQMSAEERRKLVKSRKSKFGDLSEIAFPAINPDKFVTWLYRYTSFIYTWWFTALSLIAIGVMTGISISHWGEIGRDTLEFFTFTDKSWGDVGVFYVLALATMCIHELAHAHACKHYGGRVPSMGFMLVYLTPAFFTDTSEGFVKASRFQRLIIAMAGAWAELLICAIATPIWWATPPDTPTHNLAYLLMLMTGLASLTINWNPLMKLDGYYMLSEIINIGELKEISTAYVSAWVKRKIWRLPVDIPYVPRRRRLGFAVYALLSGAYSYMILYVLARFVGNVFRNFNPDWSFIPEIATAALIFRSRIRKLVEFMKFVYLDKKDRVWEFLKSPRALAVGAGVVVFLLLPLFHENATSKFVWEPGAQTIVRNHVPGIVSNVYVREGMAVAAGTPIMNLRDVKLASNVAAVQAEYEVANKRAVSASLHYGNTGAAEMEKGRLERQAHELGNEAGYLEVQATMPGVILTARPDDRLGAYVPAGTELATIGDVTRMRARIYVSEHDLYQIKVGERVQLLTDGVARTWRGQVASVTPASSELEPGMVGAVQYKGLNPPKFYLVDVYVGNMDGALKPGLTGMARIYGERSSLAGLAMRDMARFFARKAW
ncbi:MAG: HlyD family efflux transporter periplasmic adaptor subunit [Candidatus Acidiferrum sp.]